MCLKKLCKWLCQGIIPPLEPPTEPVIKTKKTILSLAINDYDGNANDLNGCLNDQADLINRLKDDYPDFRVKIYQDSEVTTFRFKTVVANAVAELNPGDHLFIHYSGHGTQVYDASSEEEDGYDEALYLYDGPLIDDDINKCLQGIPKDATVVVMFDSCFSGSATRKKSVTKSQPRFHAQPEHPVRHKVRRRLGHGIVGKRPYSRAANLNWVAFAGCDEDEVSYDAYIDGQYNGAFTYYALKALTPGISYVEWYYKMRDYLPNSYFNQHPQCEGPHDLINEEVFNN